MGKAGLFLAAAILLGACASAPGVVRLGEGTSVELSYEDGEPVAVSIGEESVLELKIQQDQSDQNPYHPMYALMAPFYLANVSVERETFHPDRVVALFWAEFEDGTISFKAFRGADDDYYSQLYSAGASRAPSVTGGYYTFLFGGTIGETIIAANQAEMARSASAEARRGEASRMEEFLVGTSTLDPGESVSGGIGLIDGFAITIVIDGSSGALSRPSLNSETAHLEQLVTSFVDTIRRQERPIDPTLPIVRQLPSMIWANYGGPVDFFTIRGDNVIVQGTFGESSGITGSPTGNVWVDWDSMPVNRRQVFTGGWPRSYDVPTRYWAALYVPFGDDVHFIPLTVSW